MSSTQVDDWGLAEDEHCVAVGTEFVALFDCFFVGLDDKFVATKCRYHHEHCAEWHVEVGDKCVADCEVVRREDKFVGPAGVGHDVTVHAY